MIKQNLHTHSIYCDGKDTIEAMALTEVNVRYAGKFKSFAKLIKDLFSF